MFRRILPVVFCLHFRTSVLIFHTFLSFHWALSSGRGAGIDPFTHWWHGRICPRPDYANHFAECNHHQTNAHRTVNGWRCEKIPFSIVDYDHPILLKKSLSQPVTPAHAGNYFSGEVKFDTLCVLPMAGRYPGRYGWLRRSLRANWFRLRTANGEIRLQSWTAFARAAKINGDQFDR